ncbi:MAG: glycoside hydrolase family 3 N-terminal domain-containing protein, partial [Planctomycetota bacterium]
MENCIKKSAPLKKLQNPSKIFPHPEHLSLEELVGQLFIFRWDAGNESATEELLQKFKPGGFILFGGERKTTSTWIQHFQQESSFPLFIASDMERGVGQQIRGGIEFPSQMTVSSTENPQYAFQMGYHTALQAKSLGVNLLFAPVADVNNNPENPIIKERSYGSDPHRVA